MDFGPENIEAEIDNDIKNAEKPVTEGDPEDVKKINGVVEEIKDKIKKRTDESKKVFFAGLDVKVGNKRFTMVIAISGETFERIKAMIMQTLKDRFENRDLYDGKITDDMFQEVKEEKSEATKLRFVIGGLKINRNVKYEVSEECSEASSSSG